LPVTASAKATVELLQGGVSLRIQLLQISDRSSIQPHLTYREQILGSALLPFFSEMQERLPNLLFQPETAFSHCAKAMSEWLMAHNIPPFPHPPSSPDVSPIEPVWLVLKHICAHPIKPTNYVELQQAIFEA
jgi:hypothetical protein